MSYPQYQYYANDNPSPQQANPMYSSSEWGVDRLADRVPERPLTSDYPDRPSRHQHDKMNRQWSTPTRESSKPEYFGYKPTSSTSKYEQAPRHSFSAEYQANSSHTRVYEPHPSPKELVESQSRILEAQMQEIGPLPLLLYPQNIAYHTQSAELSAQASLEESIMLQLQNPPISSNTSDKRKSTLDSQIFNPIERAESPPIPNPRTNEWYTSSPRTTSPSSTIFSQNDIPTETNGEEAPSSSPSGASNNNMSSGPNTTVISPPISTLDNGRQQNQSHFIMIPIGRVSEAGSLCGNVLVLTSSITDWSWKIIFTQ